MIIDIHTHTFPDALAARAVAVLAERSNVTPYSDGTCMGLCASMQIAGVDRSVVMPIATKPAQVRSINSWAVEINRSFEQLICFGTIHPKQDDWQTEIDLLVSDGIQGVKFHPDYQEFFVDDAELVPIYKTLADAGLIVLFHAGVDIGLPPPVHCTPDRLVKVMDAVPDLIVIAAHMGGYALWDDVDKFLVGRKLYLDTSYSMTDLGTDRMTELIRAHGADKVLFGTDSPWTDQFAEISGIRALPLRDDEIDAILGGNAERLLVS